MGEQCNPLRILVIIISNIEPKTDHILGVEKHDVFMVKVVQLQGSSVDLYNCTVPM